MYTVIRSYDLSPGKREVFIQQVQDRLVPLLNHVPGFRTFMLLETGNNHVLFISTFHTFADAKASARLAHDWHTEHHNGFIREETRIAAGEVRIQQAWGDRLNST